MASCLDCFFCEGKRLSQKPSMTLALNCDSSVINTITKEASLPFTVNSSSDHDHVLWHSTGHRHPHGLWQQPKPRISAWSLVAVQTVRPLSKHRAGTPLWPLVGSNIGLRHQHSFRRQHRRWRSTWSSGITRATDVNRTRSHRTTDTNLTSDSFPLHFNLFSC